MSCLAVAEALGPDVPLGLVGSYVGGTPVESWTPGLSPAEKDPQGHKFAVLYNAMISPLTGMTIRVVLWYQGILLPLSMASEHLYRTSEEV